MYQQALAPYAREQATQADQALQPAAGFAGASRTNDVVSGVFEVASEITGGPEAARIWLKSTDANPEKPADRKVPDRKAASSSSDATTASTTTVSVGKRALIPTLRPTLA